MQSTTAATVSAPVYPPRSPGGNVDNHEGITLPSRQMNSVVHQPEVEVPSTSGETNLENTMSLVSPHSLITSSCRGGVSTLFLPPPPTIEAWPSAQAEIPTDISTDSPLPTLLRAFNQLAHHRDSVKLVHVHDPIPIPTLTSLSSPARHHLPYLSLRDRLQGPLCLCLHPKPFCRLRNLQQLSKLNRGREKKGEPQNCKANDRQTPRRV
jgi:hypothetical protein